MGSKAKRPLPKCGIDYAFQRIGGKYKGRILWRLRLGTLRYGELRRTVTGVNAKMLTQALRELEDLVQADPEAAFGEHLGGRLQDALAIPLGVPAQRPRRTRGARYRFPRVVSGTPGHQYLQKWSIL